MKIVKCKAGHYYNSDNYSECPICEENKVDENMSFVYGSPKFDDWEVTQRLEEARPKLQGVAVPLYAAPEILSGESRKSEPARVNVLYGAPPIIKKIVPEPIVQNAYITVNSGEMKGYSHMFTGVPVEIGREVEHGVKISKSYNRVSRHHCTIWFNESSKSFTVKDFSSNGILYRNGQRLNEITEVQPGTVLWLGSKDCEIVLSLATPVYPYSGMSDDNTNTIYNAPGM